MSNNQYIYFDSKDSNGNNPADFHINFSKPIKIEAGSLLRPIHLNLTMKKETYEITNDNNVFSFSVGKPWAANYAYLKPGFNNVVWNNIETLKNSYFFYKVTLEPGEYSLDNKGVYKAPDGRNEYKYLSSHIEQKMNESWSNQPYYRGGWKVELNSDGLLVFKLSPMNEIYEIPHGANREPSNIYKYLDVMKQYFIGNSIKPERRRYSILQPIFLQTIDFPKLNDADDQYFGISWFHQRQYVEDEKITCLVTPPLNVFGTDDANNGNLVFKYYVDLILAFNDLLHEQEFINDTNFINLYLVSDMINGLTSKTCLDANTFFAKRNLSNEIMFKITAKHNLNKGKYDVTIYNNKTTDIGLQEEFELEEDAEAIFEMKSYPPENNENAYRYQITVWFRRDENDDFALKFTSKMYYLTNFCQDVVPENQENVPENIKNRLATPRLVIANSYNQLEDTDDFPQGKTNFCYRLGTTAGNPQKLCLNYDPGYGGEFGFFDGNYQEPNSLTREDASVDLPVVLYSLPLESKNKEFIANVFNEPWTNDILNQEINPNMGNDFFSDYLTSDGSASWDTGLTVDYTPINNESLYLNLPQFTFQNYTGDSTFGKINNIVCAVTDETQNYGDQQIYNQISTSGDQQITNLNIKITNSEGYVTESIDSIEGCLEISTNKDKLMKELIEKIDKIREQPQQYYSGEPITKTWQ